MSGESRETISNLRESLVSDYFKLVSSGDVSGLSNLFSDDSMIYEPFSKSECLIGKSEIVPFLRTVIMANKGMHYNLEIEKPEQSSDENLVFVLVRFSKGGSTTCKFRFEFQPRDESNCLRIKTIHIEFIH